MSTDNSLDSQEKREIIALRARAIARPAPAVDRRRSSRGAPGGKQRLGDLV